MKLLFPLASTWEVATRTTSLLTLFLIYPALIGWWRLQPSTWHAPAGRQIAPIVRGAVSVNEALLAPPQAYRNVPVTAAEMHRFLRRAQRSLADYFTGAELANWRRVAESTLSAKDLHSGKDDLWLSNWKVDWVHPGGLTIRPGQITATATANAEYQSNGGVINRLDYTFHLRETPVGWRVDWSSFQFEPGNGP